MADFHTQFSCIFDVGTAENAARAEMIRGESAAELDGDEGETRASTVMPNRCSSA